MKSGIQRFDELLAGYVGLKDFVAALAKQTGDSYRATFEGLMLRGLAAVQPSFILDYAADPGDTSRVIPWRLGEDPTPTLLRFVYENGDAFIDIYYARTALEPLPFIAPAKETQGQRRARRLALLTEEKRRNPRGAVQRAADREGITRQAFKEDVERAGASVEGRSSTTAARRR